MCLGASQSAGRALVGYLSPASRRAEFFGLWGLAVKLASILGPITYGAVTWLSGGDHRLAMLVTGSFFVLGLLVLLGLTSTAAGVRPWRRNKTCNRFRQLQAGAGLSRILERNSAG